MLSPALCERRRCFALWQNGSVVKDFFEEEGLSKWRSWLLLTAASNTVVRGGAWLRGQEIPWSGDIFYEVVVAMTFLPLICLFFGLMALALLLLTPKSLSGAINARFSRRDERRDLPMGWTEWHCGVVATGVLGGLVVGVI